MQTGTGRGVKGEAQYLVSRTESPENTGCDAWNIVHCILPRYFSWSMMSPHTHVRMAINRQMMQGLPGRNMSPSGQHIYKKKTVQNPRVHTMHSIMHTWQPSIADYKIQLCVAAPWRTCGVSVQNLMVLESRGVCAGYSQSNMRLKVRRLHRVNGDGQTRARRERIEREGRGMDEKKGSKTRYDNSAPEV